MLLINAIAVVFGLELALRRHRASNPAPPTTQTQVFYVLTSQMAYISSSNIHSVCASVTMSGEFPQTFINTICWQMFGIFYKQSRLLPIALWAIC